ncbi:hypothetical protein QJQ45_011950 [Haematococcus lacustris]|nr:hypothetical protein QJQ45_011950 [Haematococcus lacustris]
MGTALMGAICHPLRCSPVFPSALLFDSRALGLAALPLSWPLHLERLVVELAWGVLAWGHYRAPHAALDWLVTLLAPHWTLVLRACCKVVCRPRGTDQRRGRVVLVDKHRTSRVSSAVNGQQPLAPRKPSQAPCSSQAATQPAASEPGPSTPLPAKRSKRTKAEPAAEPNKGKGKAQGKAAKAKPAPQPGRWLDRDCNAAVNMQRIGESK